MTCLLYTHPACLEHDTGPGHPESRARLEAVLDALEAPRFRSLIRHPAPRADDRRLRLIHSDAHIEAVFAAIPRQGHARLDPDTVVSPASGEAARRAAGAVCAAVDAVLAGEARCAFCAVRPPGHHAEPERAMGFCLFNNVAIGARHALDRGLERVAVVDFDLHHGNGTQAAFEREPRVLYCSTHQYPWYPGTGAADETGVGNLVNVPLPAGTDGPAFRQAVEKRILPALTAFRPQLILVSAGFDTHRLDPLGALLLEEPDYAWITRRLLGFGTPIVSALEGGYHHQALAASAATHVETLLEG